MYEKSYGSGQMTAAPYNDCDVPKAVPFTEALLSTAAEQGKYIEDMIQRVGRLNERLFGPEPEMAQKDGNNKLTPVRSALEEITFHNRLNANRLVQLSAMIARLEVL